MAFSVFKGRRLEKKNKHLSFPLPRKKAFCSFLQESRLSLLDNNKGQLNNERQLNNKGQLNSKGQLIKKSSDVFFQSRPKAGKLAYSFFMGESSIVKDS